MTICYPPPGTTKKYYDEMSFLISEKLRDKNLECFIEATPEKLVFITKHKKSGIRSLYWINTSNHMLMLRQTHKGWTKARTFMYEIEGNKIRLQE